MPPSYPPGFKKAELEIEGGETIQCLFNPTEYTITKTNNWKFKPVTGTVAPDAASSAAASRATMQLSACCSTPRCSSAARASRTSPTSCSR